MPHGIDNLLDPYPETDQDRVDIVMTVEDKETPVMTTETDLDLSQETDFRQETDFHPETDTQTQTVVVVV